METILLNLEGLTEEELVRLKLETDASIAHIQSQIDSARIDAQEGEYSDRNWWKKANSARKIKGVQSQQLQHALGQLRAEKRKKNSSNFESKFIEVARRKLPPELFSELTDITLRLVEQRDEKTPAHETSGKRY